MKKYILTISCLFFFTFTSQAHAYLDPGTGSIILQAILGFIAAAAATASFYWNKVKLFFSKLFKKDQSEKRE